jgi:threonine synthase
MPQTQVEPIDNSVYLQLPYVLGLRCLECGRSYSLEELRRDYGTINLYIDDVCFGPLDVIYDMQKIRKVLTLSEVKERCYNNPTFAMLKELLPLDEVIIEDVPFTPLTRLKSIEEKIKAEFNKNITVYGKIESTPSISFKYRPTALAINRALEDNNYSKLNGFDEIMGLKYLSTASTFNLAKTSNQLAEKYNLGSLLFIPESIGTYKIDNINAHSNSPLERIEHEQLTNAKERDHLIDEYARQIIEDVKNTNLRRRVVVFGGDYDTANDFSLYVLNTAMNLAIGELRRNVVFGPNSTLRPPYKEGSKTIGYEIALQLMFEHGLSPDKHVYFIAPAGSCAMGCAATKGIGELRTLDIFPNKFSVVFAQPEKVMPIVHAYARYVAGVNENKEIRPFYENLAQEKIKWDRAGTLAQSIAIAKPGSGDQGFNIMLETGGSAIGVKERQIIEGLLDLKELEGISAQDVGGVTLSALYNGARDGTFNDGDVVVVGITGVGTHLMKDKILEFVEGTDLEKRVEILFE